MSGAGRTQREHLIDDLRDLIDHCGTHREEAEEARSDYWAEFYRRLQEVMSAAVKELSALRAERGQ